MGAPASTQQIVEFTRSCLQQGFTQEEIAQSLSVDPSYISQLCAAHQLQPVDGTLQDIDDLYKRAEKQALEQLMRVLGTVHDPLKLTRIATQLNATKRRSVAPPSITEGSGNKFVTLQMPQLTTAQFTFNANGEAVAYSAEGEQRPLVTVTADQLTSMARQRAEARTVQALPAGEVYDGTVQHGTTQRTAAECADSDM